MSENKKSLTLNQKKSIIGFLTGIVIGLLVLFVLWYFEVITFGSKSSPSPYEASYFDFPINDGIKERKAYTAYQKFLSLTEAEKSKMAPGVYDALLANQKGYTIAFSKTENVGIIYIFADTLLRNIKILDALCNKKDIPDHNKQPTLENLLVELACHIKMRKEREFISFTQYEEYLYTIEDFAKNKDDMRSIKCQNIRAKMELGMIQEMCATMKFDANELKIFEVKSLLGRINQLFKQRETINKEN